jgi:outer membrane protein
MNRSVWLRWGVAALPAAVALLVGGGVHAEVVDPEPSFSLKLSKALRERTFMRAGLISVNVKTTSGAAYDVSDPVLRKGELASVAAQLPLSDPRRLGLVLAGAAMDSALTSQGLDGLGTPPGIKSRADDNMLTPAISVGYYLNDDFTWLVEAYVLAAPLKSEIYGQGVTPMQRPNGIDGKHILSTKLLPPTVMFGRYWGDKQAKFRPYTGLMATYAIFFDTKATQAFNDYAGGTSPGDTSVSLKNAFGVGPALGFKYQFNDDWHASLNVGSVKLKTQATLTTRNTVIRSGDAVLNDYPADILNAIATANSLSVLPAFSGGAVTVLMNAVSESRGLSNGSLGTYVRKQDTTLTNTLFMFSVGRSF